MQDTIASAVLEAMRQVNVVSDEDRKVFQEIYGMPVEEAEVEDDDDYYYGEVGDYGVGDTVTRTTVALGGEVLGDNGDDNAEFAALICTNLLTEGDVRQEDGRKVYSVVKRELDAYPKMFVNGKSQNYFKGGPNEFAADLAAKIEDGLNSKGLLGKIAGFLKLRR